MTISKKKLWPLFSLIGLFFIISLYNISYGAQTDYSAVSDAVSCSGGCSQYFPTTDGAQTTPFTHLHLKLRSTASYASLYNFQLAFFKTGEGYYCQGAPYMTGPQIWSAPNQTVDLYYNMDQSCDLPSSGDFRIIIFAYGSDLEFLGTASTLSGYSTTVSGLQNIYFETTNSSGAPTPMVSITSPAASSTTSTLDTVSVAWDTSSYGTTTDPYIRINYKLNDNYTLTHTSEATIATGTMAVATGTLNIPINSLSNGTWTITPYFYQVLSGIDLNNSMLGTGLSTNELLYTGDAVSVTISSSTAPAENTSRYSATTTINEMSATCDPNSGWFSSSMCNMLMDLFYPDGTEFQGLADLKEKLAKKPPFGYFTLVKDALNSLQRSGTSTLVASSTMASFPIFTTIRTGLAWVLWFLFGFWLIIRIRHLQI